MSSLKVGALVRWKRDGDIGIVIGFVERDVGPHYTKGHPIIQWMTYSGPDASVGAKHKSLEILNEPT